MQQRLSQIRFLLASQKKDSETSEDEPEEPSEDDEFVPLEAVDADDLPF